MVRGLAWISLAINIRWDAHIDIWTGGGQGAWRHARVGVVGHMRERGWVSNMGKGERVGKSESRVGKIGRESEVKVEVVRSPSMSASHDLMARTLGRTRRSTSASTSASKPVGPLSGRRRLMPEQIQALQDVYERNSHPSKEERAGLARQLNL